MSNQPIYQAYLDQGIGTEETPIYKFIIWASGKANEYKKEMNIDVITNNEEYLNYIKNSNK